MQCDGDCARTYLDGDKPGHSGLVRTVVVDDSWEFNYCEYAVEQDRMAGFEVWMTKEEVAS